MLPVVFGLVLPGVLMPLVGAVVSIGFEIDQHYLGIREIIPQQVVSKPVRCERMVSGIRFCLMGLYEVDN